MEMEMVNRTPNWWADVGAGDYFDNVLIYGVPTTRHLLEPKELATKMKLKNLCIDAKDIILCPNGQILFRVDE